MYCSANNGISLPSFNLSGDFNNEEITLLHHDLYHPDFLSHCLLESSPTNGGDQSLNGTLNKSRSRPQSEKKDGHRKIFTAQGPRNRRIRLSMEIGRKFFDLQDLLGFEKASKTLDWLLTKSKTAIKELIQMKDIDDIDPRTKSFCSSSEYENHLDQMKMKKKKMRKLERKDLEKGRIVNYMRAKARERARERTKEKNLLRKLAYLNPSISDQPIRTCTTQTEALESNNCQNSSTISLVNGFLCFQPNLIISRESSSSFSHLSQNLDNISSSITSFSFCDLTNITSSRGQEEAAL